jgi:hypothetical protein
MSIGSAAAASIGGMWMCLNAARARQRSAARLSALDHEDADRMIDYTMIDGGFDQPGRPRGIG